MNLLVLGDVMGSSGRSALKNKLPKIITENKILKVNKYGMLEPIKSKQKIPNIMLVPLLTYDKNKHRLGYGKGFYDRYLNRYLKKFKNILTVGVAFSFQKHHKLQINNMDVKLNYILTEKGIY